MVGLKTKDIDKDIIMLFVICYEYSMSFTNVLKLFQISRKYFWTFMEICSPMIKMGVRKAACIRKSAEKILSCFKNPEKLTEELTPREEKMFEALTWFIQDSFTDGESCFHISQFSQLPFEAGYSSNDLQVTDTFEGLVKNVDNIEYIKFAGSKFYKTSRFLYFMEKYSGETDWNELNTLSVTDMIRRISDGAEKRREKEEEYIASSRQ